MKFNFENFKLCVTNYRWYIAVLWVSLLILVFFLPILIISWVSRFFGWFALQLVNIVDAMLDFSQKHFTWAVKWFYNSLPKEEQEITRTVDKD